MVITTIIESITNKTIASGKLLKSLSVSISHQYISIIK